MKTLYLSLLSVLLTGATFAQFTNQLSASNNMEGAASLASFAVVKEGNALRLSWTAMNENNMLSHEIQKSTNGSSFSSIGTVAAQNNPALYQYTFSDATPVSGNNYYRLRSTDETGRVSYSNILQLNDGVYKTDFVVLPNPVNGGVLNLQLFNFSSGKYNISLYSNGGQKVFARSTYFSQGSSTEVINLPPDLGKGLYFLQVTDGVNRINKQVMLQ